MMNTQLLPLSTELTYSKDSALLFEKIRHLPWPVMLDSANTGCPVSRYDIISAAPFITLQTSSGETKISTDGHVQLEKRDPFSLLNEILAQYPQQASSVPFAGGAIGYFAYDLGRYLEKIPTIALDEEDIPDMAVGIYDWAIVVDHQLEQTYLLSYGVDNSTTERWAELVNLLTSPDAKTTTSFTINSELRSNFNSETYTEAFNKIQHYISEGDCYQVNLANRFEVDAQGDAWLAYKQLRQRNAAPFSAFFETEKVTLLSSSPERLLKVKNNEVETKPIKGTRPRDLTDPIKDKSLADSLQASLKDRAENLMIVDLLRNDIGKVCQPGSIRVPTPFALESFATVHHLVSTITGTLKPTETSVSLLRACFPGGSITGAPKLRAMEIIEELEPHRRGAYCGSIGFIGFDGNMDTNITIRTLVFSNNKLRFWAGGGIVADSVADEEYQEVHDKAAAIFQLIDALR